MIREMPKIERPREKLINNGVNSLSNIELIALILRSGNTKLSVLGLSRIVLNHLEKIQDLRNISVFDLMKIPGIKEAKATTLIAAIELGKRLEVVSTNNYEIRSSLDIYILMKDIQKKEQENFYCLCLDTKMKVIKKELVYKGTVDQLVIHPREVFKMAIKVGASSIIMIHNHPSGNSTPSPADNNATKKLKEIGSFIGIEVLDHIIIGKNEYYSYAEKQVKIV